MTQDVSQKFFLLGISLIIGTFILIWLVQSNCYYCQNNCYDCDNDLEKIGEQIIDHKRESFSPYRNTGGCSSNTGYKYLDEYNGLDYYQKHPYIYPTPTNYIRALYSEQRKQNAFIEKQRIELAREYAEKHEIYE